MLGLWGSVGVFYNLNFQILASLYLWSLNFTRVLSVFFTPLGETGWLKWALVRYFPCPGQLDSKITLADYSGLLIPSESRFCWEQIALSYFKMVYFPYLGKDPRGFFSYIFYDNIIEILQINLTMLYCPLHSPTRTMSSWSFWLPVFSAMRQFESCQSSSNLSITVLFSHSEVGS